MGKKWTIYIKMSVLLLLICAAPDKQEEVLIYKGIARDLYSNHFYYVEEHQEIREHNELRETVIYYRDSSNSIIAQKRIDYTANKVRPSFEQNDYRDGYTEAVSVGSTQMVLKYRKNKSESLKTKTLNIPADLVVDGGFNYYIKTNWETLQHGKTLVFNFAVPSQLDYFSFRLYKESAQQDQVIFRMEPDNFILRRLVEPIRVTYHTSSKRIIRYEGLSNINDKKGKSYLVRIQYPKVGP